MRNIIILCQLAIRKIRDMGIKSYLGFSNVFEVASFENVNMIFVLKSCWCNAILSMNKNNIVY